MVGFYGNLHGAKLKRRHNHISGEMVFVPVDKIGTDF